MLMNVLVGMSYDVILFTNIYHVYAHDIRWQV